MVEDKTIEINFQNIEKKWQDKWEKEKCFVAKEGKKEKYYVLEQFPYPSGTGLHVGHSFVYTIGDIFSRFKKMSGFNVMHPMGYDSLGLPAENAAINEGVDPKKYTEKAIDYFSKQQKSLGLSYDWSRMFATHNPDYYRWDQWIFLKMFEKGLAYKKESPVNWCPKCQTVLANEQVHNGKCWRHEDTQVQVKHLSQWYLKITNYADELANFESVKDWPDLITKLQKNWIGKSFGSEIDFEIENKNKVILVDAINTFVIKGQGIFGDMHKLLEEFPNRKIILTNANDEEFKRFELEKMPYEVFTLKHNPEKKDPEYYKKLLDSFGLNAKDVIYFEHNDDAIKSAKSLGITTFYYDKDKRDIVSLKKFIRENLNEKWPIFTTRSDTIFGVTFMVISAQHPRLMELTTDKQKKEVEEFIKRLSSVKQEDIDQLEKEGVFTGSYAINPVNHEKIPVYAGNFVLADYGCGMVMAVPAHDQRDFEFAKKYKIPVKIVIQPDAYNINAEKMSRAYTNDGVLVESGEFNGWNNRNAIDEITKFLNNKGVGRKVVNYRLRDWLVSRQRYWGTPIPIINCEKCGVVAVPEKELPVILPQKVKFGKGNPLETAEDWIKVKCPKCKGPARRETDTMDTFVNSSWYYLRYCDSKNNKQIFDSKKTAYWTPIDMYVGGREHACMHDIYMRFYHKFLRDLGLLKSDEPAKRLFVQGIVHGQDGNKMSKSLGNVVDPMDIINKYGADSLRMFLVSVASPDSDFNWSDKGVENINKLLKRMLNYFETVKLGKSSKRIESKINKAIKLITEDIENLRYNLAVIKLRQLFESFEEEISKKDLMSFLKMLCIFCPHISEELWEKLGGKGFISLSKWPVCDEKKIDEQLDKIEEAIDKTVSDITNILKILREKQNKEGEKIYVYVMPIELGFYSEEKLSKRIGKPVKIFSVSDKAKYDPKAIAGKSKPGKPGIYIE